MLQETIVSFVMYNVPIISDVKQAKFSGTGMPGHSMYFMVVSSYLQESLVEVWLIG